MLRIVVALALVAVADAFVSFSQGRFGTQIQAIQELHRGRPDTAANNPYGFLWHLPEESSDPRGLGGGITWAMDDALCDQMMGSFGESLIGFRMSTCETMKAAIHRAFDSWAANSAKISFVDVTKECQQRLNRHDANCPLAEIWITWMTTRDSKPTGNSTNQASRDLLMTSS